MAKIERLTRTDQSFVSIVLTIRIVLVFRTTRKIVDLGNLRLLDGHGDPRRRSIPILTYLPPLAASVWRSFRESPRRCNEVPPFPIHSHKSSHSRIQFVRRIRSEGEEFTALVRFHSRVEGFWGTSRGGLDDADETEAVPVEFFRRSNRSEVSVCTNNAIKTKPK